MPDHPEYLDYARQACAAGVAEPREFMAVVFVTACSFMLDADESLGTLLSQMADPPTPGAYSATRLHFEEINRECSRRKLRGSFAI